jgi:hypothetical protein
MITWHARAYNLRKYRPTTAYCIKLGKSGTRRSPGPRDEPTARMLAVTWGIYCQVHASPAPLFSWATTAWARKVSCSCAQCLSTR